MGHFPSLCLRGTSHGAQPYLAHAAQLSAPTLSWMSVRIEFEMCFACQSNMKDASSHSEATRPPTEVRSSSLAHEETVLGPHIASISITSPHFIGLST